MEWKEKVYRKGIGEVDNERIEGKRSSENLVKEALIQGLLYR